MAHLNKHADDGDDDDDNPDSYTLEDLEHGQHSRLLNDRVRSASASSSRADVPSSPGASLIEKLLRNRLSAWIQGPRPPRPYTITPMGGAIQLAGLKQLRTWVPNSYHRNLALLGFFAVWLLSFILILHTDNSTGVERTRLSCISRLWPGTQTCGLDGVQCLPFNNNSFEFRCPAYCRHVKVLNPYAIGVEEINYRSLVIGGPTESAPSPGTYRGDSFICAAAIHAGVIDDKTGGCGSVSLTGQQRNFFSSDRNGIKSAGFNSSFPLSFTFDRNGLQGSPQCNDPQWRALGVSVLFTTILSICTTSSALFFSSVFSSTFFQTALASDPPDFATYDGVVSSAVGRFLPAAFVALFIYQYCVRYTLRNLKAQFEKTVLWLGGCWVGAIGQNIFDKIPISRLTPHDLQQQPGAVPALVAIIMIVAVIAVTQIWAFRIEGRLSRYLALYAILGVFVVALLGIPRLHLRLHHYILALLLLPGTTLQTRPSLLYQGFLVGLFINGVARWGFDSVLQTDVALRTDEKLGSSLPTIHTPKIEGNNITFSLDLDQKYDGISVLVNDVERHRVLNGEKTRFTWTRIEGDEVEYFRFGFVKYGRVGGILLQDYTKAGVWTSDGHWTPMPPG